MRSRPAETYLAAALCLLAWGCARVPAPPSAPLDGDEALRRLRERRVETFEGKGRLAIRSPSGISQLGFRIAYDAGAGFRVDLTWRALAGLFEREGSILVRGDSVWVATPEEEGEEVANPAGDLPLFGFTPVELAALLIEAPGAPLENEKLLSFRKLPEGDLYRLVLTSEGRRRTVELDGATGDPLSQDVADLSSGRRLSISYGKYRGEGVSRRPTEVEFRDSEGPVRGKFLFSDQRSDVPLDAALFRPGPESRLVRPTAEVGSSPTPRGTLSPLRGGFQV